MSAVGPLLQNVVQQLQATAAQATTNRDPIAHEAGYAPDSFAAALMHSIDRVDALKQTAVAQGHAFERGEPGIGINDVMVDMEKAGVAFEMSVQVRNRVVNAYKDIMNMQV
ncbi:flagellar hook-basal body complex protein FliE [Salinisphaera sp. T31B1]|uniref:flagellar hook-basal body complex protein FliE n=1 Tax=Salinisphaera sp. T31B1 TaxID=727963 RepID=UPI00334059DB